MKVIIRKSINGGRADKIACADLAKKYNVPVEKMQDKLQTGITVEMEHTDRRSQAREIAMDHLSEQIDYYDKLEAAGLADELEKSVKDLSYWKKKLMAILSGEKMGKSLDDASRMVKGKAYPIGTKRTWNGKDYKKVAGGPTGKGKWMRTYSGKDDRGERQAVRNVMKKIQNASSMEELSEIVSQNMSRFKDDSGKTLPIVKDFMTAARGTSAGKKESDKVGVGFSWMSPEGESKVVKKHGSEFLVKEGDSRGGSLSIMSESRIRKQKEIDGENIVYREKVAESTALEAGKEAQKKKEYEDVDGFADNMTPLKRGKVLDHLNRTVKFENKLMTEKEYYRLKVDRGYRTNTDHGERRLYGKNDEWSSKDSKTGLDYAEYLISKKEPPREPEKEKKEETTLTPKEKYESFDMKGKSYAIYNGNKLVTYGSVPSNPYKQDEKYQYMNEAGYFLDMAKQTGSELFISDKPIVTSDFNAGEIMGRTFEQISSMQQGKNPDMGYILTESKDNAVLFPQYEDVSKKEKEFDGPEATDSELARTRKVHEGRSLSINKMNLEEAKNNLKDETRPAMKEALKVGIKQIEDVIAGKEKKEPLKEPKAEPVIQEDSPEIAEAKNKIRILQKKQKQMKDVNKIAKKKNVSDEEKIKQLVSELGLKESTAKLVMEPDYMGRTGFASFELTNNNAKIKAAINKITDLERRAEQKETFKPIEFDGGSIDIQDDRVVIDHDIKPDRDVIQKLKGRGFRWTPSIGAWTRKHTRQAVYDAKDVLGLQKSRIIIRGESLQKAKYITKKMVNGKWVYKYQEEKGKHGATNTPDLFISPDKFDAGAYFAKTDDPTATAESIMAKASPELRAKIAETEARLKKITPTINNHRTSGEGAAAVYTPERQKIHESIILKMLSSDKIKAAMPKQGEQPTFTMLGGRGGSGKSWFNGKVYNPETTIVMDSDEIKGQLPEYEGWNAFEVHEESSDILEKAVAMAKSYGLNIVIDATMKTTSSAVERVLDFKKSGYNIKAHYMHAPRQVSAKRAVSRFNGASGRYVPVGVVLSNTSNEKTFDAVKNYASSWSFHDSSGNPPPELISRKNGALKMAKAINTTKETSKRDPHDMYDFGPITDPKDYSEDLKRMIEKNRPGTIKKSRIVVRGNSSKK